MIAIVMEKICFVVCQYGDDVNGGAEVHCKMLAERLSSYYKVDIITTKIINYHTFEEYYTTSHEIINDINVFRFSTMPFDAELHNQWRKRTKWPRKFRRTLFRVGLLRPIAKIFPIWNFGVGKEIEMVKTHGFYSADLLTYLRDHKDDYKAIIFMTYYWSHTIFGSMIAPEKSILIPTAHNESDLFRPIQTHVFTKVKHIAFNTEEEQKLAENIFGSKMSDHSIVAVGVEMNADIPSKEELYEKFSLPEMYILYFGRISHSKNVDTLIAWFIDYKRKYPSELKLVLTGRLFQDKIDHPDVMYTGFVTEGEKLGLIKHAKLVVNPSKHESLSLLLLEAMKLGKTVLVNGRSEVMKAHCIKSGFAADYYLSKRDFENKMQQYVFGDKAINGDNDKAIAYVTQYYDWDVIINRLKNIISCM
jgi:glycosyltransferase involved in cell wall biosynthesis